jgi:hypothetical protein
VKIKSTEDVTACVVDYGTFTGLAEALSRTYKQVYYHCPVDREYRNIADDSTGEGLKKVTKLEDFFEPAILHEIDLFIFPDIGFGGVQKYLRSIGKAVWGSNGAHELELERDLFLEILEEVGLPVAESKVLKGISALSEYLKNVKNKWVKINKYRGNMETWFHTDYQHSARRLESMSVIFGGMKEHITFVVQDTIESEVECGYDGWCVDGKFPPISFQGYEKKNELYLGAALEEEDIPEEITYVNEKMSKILKEVKYRNWWATEIRVDKEGTPFFIDPTARHPGQTGEHQWETLSNIAEVIWAGANGEIIEPEFEWAFAAEATLHYEGGVANEAISQEWKILDVPKSTRRWFKPYHYCLVDNVYNFIPSDKDEVGVVLGVGDSIKECIKHLKKNLDTMKDLPVYAKLAGFKDLIDSIRVAEEHGIKFAKEIPDIDDLI